MFKCNAHGLIPLNGLSVNRFTRSESPRGYIPRVVIIDIEYILYICGRYAACIRFGSALGAVYTMTLVPRLTETLGAVYTITGASQINWLARTQKYCVCFRNSPGVSVRRGTRVIMYTAPSDSVRRGARVIMYTAPKAERNRIHAA